MVAVSPSTELERKFSVRQLDFELLESFGFEISSCAFVSVALGELIRQEKVFTDWRIC